jgi:phage-related protein
MVAIKKVQARFYESATGGRPVRDWLMRLPIEDRKVVGRDIQRVEFGWPLGMPYCRSLGRGLWEVRCDLADGRIARVIFCFVGSEIALLHGFVKKSRKTAESDIELSLHRMRDLT